MMPRLIARMYRPISPEIMAGLLVLGAALAIGLASASDFGLTIDEFNTEDYGPKALAWYTSGFIDRSHFETVEEWLWGYGPWFQILTALIQSLHFADPITVRHAATLLVGLVGIGALLPLGQMTLGSWSGVVAIMLCLTTGYFYGHLFFTPIDVPFMMAMNVATLAIVLMTARQVPSWSATVAVGLATGLAIATRTAGIITHAYLLGAMLLLAMEIALTHRRGRTAMLITVAVHILAAIALAWIFAITLWPWLQIGNPFTQFVRAHRHFWTLTNIFSFPSWGQLVTTNALPWHYVPGQLLARLPEGFLLLLVAAFVIGFLGVSRFARKLYRAYRRYRVAGVKESLLTLAQTRGTLLIVAAALIPPASVIVSGSTLYDGVRHLLFVIPMLALLAGGALIWLVQFTRPWPLVTVVLSIAAIAHLGIKLREMIVLHPLEYVSMNSLAGGVRGAYGRFELDYWTSAATEAVRRLERRLDQNGAEAYMTSPPRVIVCIPWREAVAWRLLRRDWLTETDPAKADFLISTERRNCAEGRDVVLIDQVARYGRSFAWTHASKPAASTFQIQTNR
jgi:hypothetical protein